MKKQIKIMTKVCAVLMVTLGMTFSACKKGDTGPKGDTGTSGSQGPQGQPGPSAKYYEFTLTYGSSISIQTFQMPASSMYGKITFVYLDKGIKNWVLMPYYENNPGYVPVNYVATCDEILERIQVRTDRGDNQTGSPWAANNVQKSFRAVVIEAKQAKSTNPSIDFSDYKQVKEAYNLPD